MRQFQCNATVDTDGNASAAAPQEMPAGADISGMTARPRESSIDQRVHERSEYKGVIQVQCLRDPTWFEVYGRDVSRGGFAFFCNVQLCVGESVSLCLPDLDLGTFGATVRRVSRSGAEWLIGIEFDAPLDPAVEQTLLG
jgi:hypothetical protein